MRRIGSVFPPLFVAFAVTQIAAQVSFAPEVKHAVRGGAFSAATADFDDDGNDDLAIVDENLSVLDGYVSIHRGWGKGVVSLWGDTSVRYIVRRLKVLFPTMGKVKIAQVLCRAGLLLGSVTVGRMLKEPLPRDRQPRQYQRLA